MKKEQAKMLGRDSNEAYVLTETLSKCGNIWEYFDSSQTQIVLSNDYDGL